MEFFLVNVEVNSNFINLNVIINSFQSCYLADLFTYFLSLLLDIN